MDLNISLAGQATAGELTEMRRQSKDKDNNISNATANYTGGEGKEGEAECTKNTNYLPTKYP